MGYDTSVRDQAVARDRERREELRLRMLQAIKEALAAHAKELGIDYAYIHGSVIRPGAFRDDSDIDVAVPEANPVVVAGRLTHAVGREVHVLELDDSRAARRARTEGMLWTRTK